MNSDRASRWPAASACAGKERWADLFVRASSGVKLALMDGGVLTTRSLSSWGTLNFALGGAFGEGGKLRRGVHFNNIMNEEYRSTFGELPDVGRSVELTARMIF